ncbi:hypothetical protein V6R21_19565 [Limibacter armeniacum]|uniref:hypothetical protein n=1 Tax=Limibacter armeniacum TaxID=466084 RepID=UPI002FE671EC
MLCNPIFSRPKVLFVLAVLGCVLTQNSKAQNSSTPYTLHQEITTLQLRVNEFELDQAQLLVQSFVNDFTASQHHFSTSIDLLFDYEVKKLQLLLKYKQEEAFLMYQHSDGEVLDYYCSLRLYSLQCLSLAKSLLKNTSEYTEIIECKESLKVYFYKDINFIQSKITYCGIRINDLQNRLTSYQPRYTSYNNQTIALFDNSKTIHQLHSYITTCVTPPSNNIQFATGYLHNNHKKAFIAKVRFGKIQWFKELGNANGEETIGTYVGKIDDTAITKVISINKQKEHFLKRHFIIELTEDGKIINRTEEKDVIEHQVSPLFLHKNQQNGSFLIGQSTAEIEMTNYGAKADNIQLKSIDKDGNLVWQRSVKLQGNVLDVIQFEDNFTFICNSSYSGNLSQSEPQSLSSSKNHQGILLLSINQQSGEIKYTTLALSEDNRAINVIKISLNEYSITSEKTSLANRPDALFDVVVSNKGEILYTTL